MECTDRQYYYLCFLGKLAYKALRYKDHLDIKNERLYKFCIQNRIDTNVTANTWIWGTLFRFKSRCYSLSASFTVLKSSQSFKRTQYKIKRSVFRQTK